MTNVTDRLHANPATWQNADPSDAAIVQTEAQPGFGRHLQRAADEVANHIGVAHNYLGAILRLRGVRAMEVFPERRLNSRAVLMPLQIDQAIC